MPQSLSNVLVHVVFSTKERHPFLHDATLRLAMHRYLATVSAQLRCPVIKVGGVEDHVHMLFQLGRTIAIAEAVSWDEKYVWDRWTTNAPFRAEPSFRV